MFTFPKRALEIIMGGDPVPALGVYGTLMLRCLPDLRALPKQLTVLGDLTIAACPNLKALPESLTVQGNLRIVSCRGIRSLGKRVKVGGSVALQQVIPPLSRVARTC